MPSVVFWCQRNDIVCFAVSVVDSLLTCSTAVVFFHHCRGVLPLHHVPLYFTSLLYFTQSPSTALLLVTLVTHAGSDYEIALTL